MGSTEKLEEDGDGGWDEGNAVDGERPTGLKTRKTNDENANR